MRDGFAMRLGAILDAAPEGLAGLASWAVVAIAAGSALLYGIRFGIGAELDPFAILTEASEIARHQTRR